MLIYFCFTVTPAPLSLHFAVCLHFSDDLNVDEEPPPAPPTAVVDDGLEKELEKLNEDEVGLGFYVFEMTFFVHGHQLNRK